MTKLPFLLLILQAASSQGSVPDASAGSVSAFGGMGIGFVRAADMVEYINATSTFAQRVDDYGVGIDFFGGVEIPVNEEWGIKIEHTYLFKSYTFAAATGATHDLFYSVNAPSLILQRVFRGKGYAVTFGAGGGYHFGGASEKISTFGTEKRYSARGAGVKGEIVGQTAFDDHLFGYIGGQMTAEFLGTLKDDGGLLLANTARNRQAGLDLFSAGIRFGIIYIF